MDNPPGALALELPRLKEHILQAFFHAGSADRLLELAQTERDRELRAEAIRKLGHLGSKATGPALVELYRKESDREIKQAVIQGLFVQGNAKALIDIAGAEKDRELRAEAVEQLSHMDSKAARDYLLETLKD
jgi:HEAT repeat protein